MTFGHAAATGERAKHANLKRGLSVRSIFWTAARVHWLPGSGQITAEMLTEALAGLECA